MYFTSGSDRAFEQLMQTRPERRRTVHMPFLPPELEVPVLCV